MSAVRVLPAGDRGLLLELESNQRAQAVALALQQELEQRLEDVVLGHETVFVTWPAGASSPAHEVRTIAARVNVGRTVADGRLVTLPVTYDGPDLHDVAAQTGLSPEEVARRHRQGDYSVAFIGFAPGFAYLLGLDRRLEVPRLASPRPHVAAGSVAVAGPYSAVYPSSSPGGWNLLGHTDAILFDPGRRQPALLEPGVRVRFSEP